MGSACASLFISHGAPTLPLEQSPARQFLEGLGRELPKPRAIIALSPHWETRVLALKSPDRFETWHDFGGFPEELYRMRYEPAGDSALRDQALNLLNAAGFDAAVSADRRLDHGVWTPLTLIYPQADIPLVQVSATAATPQRYFELGRALQPLAQDGVLLLGSGGQVHNLREIEFGGEQAPEWSRLFDQWVHERLLTNDWDALFNYRRLAPEAARAHPTEDHFLPLFFTGGAGGAVRSLHRSFSHGSLGMAVYGFR